MKHSKVRQHIIETASNLFYKQGYNLTGINEIIKEAGIAKATLYNHFASKEDICLAYLDFKNSTFRKDIKDFVENAKAGKDQLFALFYFLKKFYNQSDFNGCWCLNTVSEIPKENIRIKEEIQKQKEAFILFIKQLVKQNYDRDSDAQNDLLARKIYLIYESSIAESKLHQSLWPIDAGLSLCQNIIN
ncbi:TetR/AcrR family transcriptional regulator [Aquimarina sp. 2201CG5-10]|uniref:TetR/AcrR family transcriptional regulator n=1 Tax=Aquimarina callyspongiae TaxID=3098150 RepID=UPI002AB5B21A|nr:TetR/AcrR family transcriptional regulator [Aquimarina sp. 2201CG5-10]MDY8134501.1 TetR/AcrR family transcriptional regulator [Aquimarina sp. 2201CG5-10]